MPKKKDKYPFPLVVVIWDDAESDTGWEDIPEDISPALATSVGFIVKETDSHLLLASSFDENKQTNQRHQIPKKMIKEIRVIK